MSKHQEHIVCIKSSLVSDRQDGFVEYELKASDLMLGQRAVLEFDPDFRQVLPISVFTHQGKVWAYERTSKGGETRLHNKIAVAVGGHWDLDDLVIEEGCINLEVSLQQAIDRELREEVKISSGIISTRQLAQKICADDTEVDKVHLGIVWVHELDGEGVASAEDQLKGIGFVSPEALLSDEYNSEGWAKIICRCLLKDA
jgi:predicted NUDIX family phosphoesterase